MSRFLTFISIYFTQKRFRHLLYFFAADLWPRGSSTVLDGKEKSFNSEEKSHQTKFCRHCRSAVAQSVECPTKGPGSVQLY